MRVMIVDDEPLARRGLRCCLEPYADVSIVAECSSAGEAVRQASRCAPDVVFLDVEMPGTNGLEAARQISQKSRPIIVFLTAHEQYAVNAFELRALDYLLKPIDDARFETMLERVREKFAEERSRAASRIGSSLIIDNGITSGETFTVRNGNKLRVVHFQEVSWISSAGDYVVLHVGEESLMIRDSLEKLERRLAARQFVRVHRSALVSVADIDSIVSLPSRDSEIRLRNGSRIRASRRFRKQILRAIEALSLRPHTD